MNGTTSYQHNVNKGPVRQSSAIIEDFCGLVGNMRIVPTHSNQPMITFKIGSISCKALGELASAIQQTEGKQIEISARQGSFRGVTEYAVTALKAINGTAVDLRDIEGFGKQQVSAMPKQTSDNRPEKPALKVTDNYVVITIPRGVTSDQLNRITQVAREALQGLETQICRGISELATLRVTATDPADETEDIPF